MAQSDSDLIEVRLNAIRYGARDTNLYEFVRPDGKPLPAYEPGAHIDVHLPNGIVRQYSLVLPAHEPLNYTLGVKRDPASRGGSRYVHDELRVGAHAQDQRTAQQLPAAGRRRPRRPVRRRHRHHADLVHGAAARGAGPPWRLYYACRSRTDMAFLTTLEHLPRRAVPLRRRERRQIPRRRDDLARRPARTRISTAAVRRRCSTRSRPRPPIGRASRSTSSTSPPKAPPTDKKGGFIVELARSGQEFVIPEGQSILQVLLDAGIDIDYSCELGICGACEQRVISGEPEHRDAILTEEEQASNTKVMICCAGCKSERLVLDL